MPKPKVEVGGQDRDQGPHVRGPREVPDAKPEGVDTVEVVAQNWPSTHYQQAEQFAGCRKTRGGPISATDLSRALLDMAFSGRTILGLYDVLVGGQPPRYPAEKYGLNVNSLKVACTRVRAAIKEKCAETSTSLTQR